MPERNIGMAIGTSAEISILITSWVKSIANKPVFVKLTPNVTDITQPAKAAQDAGADGVSLINTLLGMSIDIHKKRPMLANNTGGLSGPAVKPVAVRMVYQVAQAVDIPILGLGGIVTGDDAGGREISGEAVTENRPGETETEKEES